MLRLLAFPAPRTSLLLVLGIVALIAVACGGGDESDGGGVTEPEPAADTATPAPTQAPPPTEAPTEPPDEGGTVDERYLRAVCVGGNDLQNAMFAAIIALESEGGDPDDPEAFSTLFVEPLAGFLEHMREVTPPDDLAEYHAAALAQYEAVVTLFSSVEDAGELGEEPLDLLGGLMAGADEFPAIPEAALERLAGVAGTVPECAGSLFLDSFLSPGGGGGGVIEEPGEYQADPEAEAYVRELCLAGDDYDATIQQAIADLEPGAELDESDPAVFAAVFGEALRGLSLAMLEMTPPAEIAEYHDAGGARFHEMANLLESILETLDAGGEVTAEQLGRFQELLAGGMGLPGLPFNEANRLGQAANNVVECFGSGFLYGFLSGGG
jgi:hypothetical protein